MKPVVIQQPRKMSKDRASALAASRSDWVAYMKFDAHHVVIQIDDGATESEAKAIVDQIRLGST